MGLETKGFDELRAGLIRMADQVGREGVNRALEAGAEPIRQQMIANASSDPHVQSGLLRSSIRTLGIKVTQKRAKASIWIGVSASEEAAYYAGFVEFGHGAGDGAAFAVPAPPHPFVIPAYNQRADEAYLLIRAALEAEVRKLRL